MTSEELAACAYALAAQGVPVFPCTLSKQPAIPRAAGGHGLYDASTSPDQVRSVFRSCPNTALIGMPTGTRSGIVVIDIDPDAIRWFEGRLVLGRFPETKVVRTRRGGFHLYFKCPNPPIKNSAGKLAKGADTRGEGGYVIIPPSDGYTVVLDAPLGPLPSWIIRVLNRKPKIKLDEAGATGRAGNLDALARFVAQSGNGERNCRLYWAARRFGDMIRSGNATTGQQGLLVSAAIGTGLPHAEACATVRSALRGSK